MKVVFIIDHLRRDGTQKVLVHLVTGLAARGHTQSVICLNDSWDNGVVDRLHSAGAEVQIIGKRSLLSGYGLYSIVHYLHQMRFDVAITLLHVSDVLGRALAKCARVPRIVSSVRARNVNYSWMQRRLVRATMNAADAVIINSSYARDFAIREEGAPAERIYIIRNGVNVEDYSNPISQAVLRDELGLPKKGWLMGIVGRLTQQKGIDILLHALSHLRCQEVTLIVVGIGEEETKLRALAARLNLESRVYFAGYRLDVSKLLGAFDLYVHPARFEGMPNAVLEAMAAARPIVASSVDGIRDLIEDGIHGWLVPPEDPASLAKAIEEVLSDPNEASRRGRLARRRVIEQFSVDSMVAAWEAVLAVHEMNLKQKESIDRYA